MGVHMLQQVRNALIQLLGTKQVYLRHMLTFSGAWIRLSATLNSDQSRNSPVLGYFRNRRDSVNMEDCTTWRVQQQGRLMLPQTKPQGVSFLHHPAHETSQRASAVEF